MGWWTKSLYRKWLEITKHPSIYKWLALGFQVYQSSSYWCQHGDLQQLSISWLIPGLVLDPSHSTWIKTPNGNLYEGGKKWGEPQTKVKLDVSMMNVATKISRQGHGLHSMAFFWGSFPQNLINLYTPWKFNIAPENIPSQKESSLPTIIFQGRKC